jgi:transposase InsO family protein
MLGDSGGATVEQFPRDRDAERMHAGARRSRACAFGQWRGDDGAESEALAEDSGTEPLFIEPGSPWENGYCESFNGKFRDECLNGEIFYSLKEAQAVVGMWQRHYNTARPHGALGYRAPAPLSWIAA